MKNKITFLFFGDDIGSVNINDAKQWFTTRNNILEPFYCNRLIKEKRIG